MALTKSQRWLFGMEVKPDETGTASARLKKAAGVIALLAVSLAVGWLVLLGYLPVDQWLSALFRETKWSVLIWLFVLCIGAFLIAHIIAAAVAMLTFHGMADVSGDVLAAVFCSCLFLAPFAFHFMANGDGPIVVPGLYAAVVFLVVISFDHPPFIKTFLNTAYGKRVAREAEAVETAFGRVESQSDLAAIALATGKVDIALSAVDRMTDAALVLDIAETAAGAEIRQYACGKLGHVFDDSGVCCSRCGVTPDGRSHDWSGSVCRRCGTKKYLRTSAAGGEWVACSSLDEWQYDTHDGVAQVFVPAEFEQLVYRAKAERDAEASGRVGEGRLADDAERGA